MSTTAIASPAALAPAAATARRAGSSGVRGSVIPARGVARRTAVATALTRSRFLGGDASPAAFVSSATGSRARSRVVGARRVQTRALASPNELGDVAGTLGLTLSGFEQVMGKASFGALLGASSVYCYKAFFTDDKRAGKPEQMAMLAGNLTLASLLAARWVESGHFPLSNMYESLLFLAWGVTGVHLVVTERDGYSKSAVPGALAAPTALMVVAGATLALPPELQRASALVPALKSNWLMMHVSVMMLSYATLLVGSLSCMSFLLVDATQGFEGAKGALGFLDNLVQGDSAKGGNEGAVDVEGEAVLAASMDSVNAESELMVKQRNRPQVSADGTVTAIMSEFPGDAQPLAGADLMREMDNLAYRCLGAGFALLTAGLISGAVWANEAWGSYWSWDPKETWALITWLVYATYLHSRLVAGKSKKEVAVVGALGFIVVWTCYVGVNLWGVGLHSYGWFANK
mmetsp:Transcript_6212/g.26935  ORF Transcript_6212/g.26935 Transcript_6212/m.26935 type:complete len:461 (-) Transcript_6212:196-1578(-)